MKALRTRHRLTWRACPAIQKHLCQIASFEAMTASVVSMVGYRRVDLLIRDFPAAGNAWRALASTSTARKDGGARNCMRHFVCQVCRKQKERMRRTFLHRAANGGCSASKASSGSSGFASRKFGCAASVPSPSCSAPFPVRIPARSSAFPSFANVPQLSAFASSRNAEPTSARVGADSLPGSSPRSSEGVSSAGPTGVYSTRI
ncbi:hypothetical protein BC830DRAFT_304388 [Chytriomyces sp. MP71]|nr:hypothetical protein BC830DRAFT_304388 [Chytriomyces sp. MP71]